MPVLVPASLPSLSVPIVVPAAVAAPLPALSSALLLPLSSQSAVRRSPRADNELSVAIALSAKEHSERENAHATLSLVISASNDKGSSISFEDYAIAAVDELEKPAHSRQRFTVGY